MTSDEKNQERKGRAVLKWAYVAVGLVINILLGTIYSWSVFRNPLQGTLGWNQFESSLPFTFFLFMFAILMPVGGRLIEKIGPRRTAILGGALVGSGWILGGVLPSMGPSLLMMVLTYGIIGGAGVGIIYGVPIAVSSRWVPERRGLAVGLTVMGFGLSPLITAPVARYVINSSGVLNTFLYLGLVFFAALVFLSMLMVFPGKQVSAGAGVASASGMKPGEMLRTGTFYGVWLAYVLGTMGGFIAISLSSQYGENVVGLDSSMAAAATSLFAVFNGIGRPAFGSLCDKAGVRIGAVVSFVLILIASLTATQSSTLPLYLLSFAILWFTFGGWLAIAPTATAGFFGLRNQSMNYGIVFTAYGAGALIGPSVAGYIYQATGAYHLAFITTAIMSVSGMLVSALLLKPVKTVKREVSR
ncbi:MAG: OFA family MFS transporter [Candidatus Hadarchaeales archaeon]